MHSAPARPPDHPMPIASARPRGSVQSILSSPARSRTLPRPSADCRAANPRMLRIIARKTALGAARHAFPRNCSGPFLIASLLYRIGRRIVPWGCLTRRPTACVPVLFSDSGWVAFRHPSTHRLRAGRVQFLQLAQRVLVADVCWPAVRGRDGRVECCVCASASQLWPLVVEVGQRPFLETFCGDFIPLPHQLLYGVDLPRFAAVTLTLSHVPSGIGRASVSCWLTIWVGWGNPDLPCLPPSAVS